MQNRWSYPDPVTEPIYYITRNSVVKVLKRRLLLQVVLLQIVLLKIALLQMVLLPSGHQVSLYAVGRKAAIIDMRFAVHVVILAWTDDVVNGKLYLNNQITALRESGAGGIRLRYVFAGVLFILLLLLSVKFFLLFPGMMNDGVSEFARDAMRVIWEVVLMALLVMLSIYCLF